MSLEVCQKTFQQASSVLDFPIIELMKEGPIEQLTQTQYAQPAILTVNVAIGRYLESHGIVPECMAGHSLGEYTCLVLSGSMSFEDALKAVHNRGKFMQEAVPMGEGAMCAVLGLADDIIEKVCHEITDTGFLVECANYNCPGQLVISGSVEGVDRASKKLKEEGAKRCVSLPVSAPFHSSMLKPASVKMDAFLKDIPFQNPQIPYVANVDADLVDQSLSIKKKLVDQIDHPVLWTQSLKFLIARYPEAQFIEVGDSKVVSGHLRKVQSDAHVFTTHDSNALQAVLDDSKHAKIPNRSEQI